jgi:GNAT superfamily N-acetyltransferase
VDKKTKIIMNLKIRKGKESDIPAVFSLIKELAEFEKAPEAVTNSIERMRKEQNVFKFFVAEIDNKIIGMAIYFFAYFTWVGKSLYLDDIYVKPDYRGQKIGSKLMQKIFEVAKKEDCQRLRWQVLDWNTNAIEIYKKLGANITNEWLNCDFNKEDINKF